jgi:hypothetical protein
MRYYDLMRLEKAVFTALFRLFWNLILIVFGGKKWRSYVFKVPKFCRYRCGHLKECRRYENNWKCRAGGCVLINDGITFDTIEKF